MATSLENQYIDESYQKLVQISGSVLADGTGSAIDNITVTASFASSASRAITASYALNAEGTNTGSLLTTASISDATITFTKGDASTFDLTVDNVASASYAATASVLLGAIVSASHAVNADHSDTTQEVIINVKNTSGGIIAKGTPVYATGVTGENINVSPADFSSTATMPAIAVTQEQLAINATGEATVTGRIVGVNTDGFTAGRNIYVNGSGTFQDTRPTGSGILVQNIGVVGKVDATDGEIVIQGSGRSNDLPNIAAGYLWVGDQDGVGSAVTSQSLWTGKDISVNTISASGASFTSASIGHLKTITGSATIIGDQYIILNSDSPTARFAGVKVYDSGSGLTGSFEWDSVDDNWIQVETNGTSAGMLTSVSGSKGSEVYPTNNTLLKGTGNHTVEDSSIVDTGTAISTSLGITAASFTGSLLGTASHALNSDVFPFTGAADITGSLTVDGDTLLNYKTAPNFASKEIITFPAFTKSASPGNGVAVNYNAMLYRNIPVAGTVNGVFQIGQGYDSNFDTYGSYLNIGNSRSEIALLASGSSGGLTTNQRSADIAVLDDGDSSYEGNAVARYYGTTIEIGIFNGRDIVVGNTRTGGGGFDTETLAIAGKDVYIGAANGISYDFEQNTVNYSGNEETGDIEFWYTGSVKMIQTGSATGPALEVSGSVSATNGFTGSLFGSASYALTASLALNTGEGSLESGDLTFENSFAEVYGSEASPLSGTITFSTTSSPKIGASAVVFHSASAEPTVVSGSYSVSKKSGVYDPTQLNIISFTYLGNSDFMQTIVGTTSGMITNATDTYTTSPKVDHIVTLTQAEYNSISASADVNTLYVTI